jgi:hypothetical protein
VSDITNRPRNLLALPINLALWCGSFLLLCRFGQQIDIAEKIAVFIGAALLTVLSELVIDGFSRLQQHRSIYLLIGAVAAVAVFHAARPMVNRSSLLNDSGRIPRQVLFLTAAVSGSPAPSESYLTATGNWIFTGITSTVKDSVPENPDAILLLALLQLTLAAGIGLWIGEGIDEAAHLIPVAAVAAFADIWSVSAGATARIIISPMINYFLLRFPIPGSSEIPYLIGLTDFLFFAIFYQSARRFNLGVLKNAVLLTLSFLIAVYAAIFLATGLPVLPFMAVIFVAGNFARLKLKREEVKQIVAFLVVISLVFAFISMAIH